MPGTFTGKALADGTLAIAAAAIYTVPGSTVAYVKSISLFNDNAVTQTILLYLNTTGTARKWRRYVLLENESVEVLTGGETVVLAAGDTIEAVTTTASVVPFTITGVEET